MITFFKLTVSSYITHTCYYLSDISSLISSSTTTTTTITLRLSSVLFSHSDDNLSLCTFASRNYREGQFAPRLIVGSDSTSESTNTADSNEKMTMLSSNMIGIQNNHKEQSSYSSEDKQDKQPKPHKLFPPKLQSSTATTQKVSKCAAPYSPSKKYAHNDVVSSQYKNYRCKSYPYTVWCNEVEYEPGVSSFWGLAWDLVNGTFVS